MLDLGKQGRELLCGQGSWQGSAPAQHVTGFDRDGTDDLMVVEEVEEMFQRIQASIDGRRG